MVIGIENRSIFDAPRDNAINMSDIMEIAKVFNCSEGNELYAAECDINKDGVINLKDIMIAAKHFNATSY